MNDKKNVAKSYSIHAQKWADRMRSGDNHAHEYLEKPAMYAKLPELNGKNILCLGCGSGEECEHLDSLGCAKVVGVDISDGLIDVAKKSYPEIEFRVMDMENLNFPEATFDFVYSSLVMHYVEDWTKTLNEIRRVLKPGGTYLFSTHHPLMWSAEKTRSETIKSNLLGYSRDLSANEAIIYGDYLNTRKITENWFGDMEVTYYHKPLSDILKEIRQSGFVVKDFIEPKSIEEIKNKYPNFYHLHQKLPLFMIFELSA